MYLVKRCLLSWRVEARQRGRNMRKLRKIMFTWLAWAKREKELKKRERLISARLHDKALGNVLMQWRWRRSAQHGCYSRHALLIAIQLKVYSLVFVI